jgi:hypothetical protein
MCSVSPSSRLRGESVTFSHSRSGRSKASPLGGRKLGAAMRACCIAAAGRGAGRPAPTTNGEKNTGAPGMSGSLKSAVNTSKRTA